MLGLGSGFRLSVRVIIDVIRLQSAVITVAVIIAECSRMTSVITPASRNAAVSVIIVNRRHDHEFVILAPVKQLWDCNP